MAPAMQAYIQGVSSQCRHKTGTGSFTEGVDTAGTLQTVTTTKAIIAKAALGLHGRVAVPNGGNLLRAGVGGGRRIGEGRAVGNFLFSKPFCG